MGAPRPPTRSRDFDALYVHIKGPDVPAHDGRAEDKRDVIAAIDRAFFGEVLPQIDLPDTVVAVTARPLHLVRAQGPHGRPGAAARGRRGPVTPGRLGRPSASARAPTGRSGSCWGPQILPRLTALMRA